VENSRKRGQKVVFIADDDEDDRLFLTEALLKVDADTQIVEAENGVELINLLESTDTDPTLIVLDMNMPLMNGLETFEAIKSIPNIPAIPTVMLSTSSDKLFVKKAMESGLSDYFVKPYSVQGFFNLATALKLKYIA